MNIKFITPAASATQIEIPLTQFLPSPTAPVSEPPNSSPGTAGDTRGYGLLPSLFLRRRSRRHRHLFPDSTKHLHHLLLLSENRKNTYLLLKECSTHVRDIPYGCKCTAPPSVRTCSPKNTKGDNSRHKHPVTHDLTHHRPSRHPKITANTSDILPDSRLWKNHIKIT
jgi:hypothetical protein